MEIVLGFVDTIDAVRASDKASIQDAVRHLRADYRNAVRVDGYTYKTIGWRERNPGEEQNPLYLEGQTYDQRVWETAPDGAWTLHKNVREALRKHR